MGHLLSHKISNPLMLFVIIICEEEFLSIAWIKEKSEKENYEKGKRWEETKKNR